MDCSRETTLMLFDFPEEKPLTSSEKKMIVQKNYIFIKSILFG